MKEKDLLHCLIHGKIRVAFLSSFFHCYLLSPGIVDDSFI